MTSFDHYYEEEEEEENPRSVIGSRTIINVRSNSFRIVSNAKMYYHILNASYKILIVYIGKVRRSVHY